MQKNQMNNWLPEIETTLLLSKAKDEHRQCLKEKLNHIEQSKDWQEAQKRIIKVLSKSVSLDIFGTSGTEPKGLFKNNKIAKNLLNNTNESYLDNGGKGDYLLINHTGSLNFGNNFNEYFSKEDKFEVFGIVQTMILEVKNKINELAQNSVPEHSRTMLHNFLKYFKSSNSREINKPASVPQPAKTQLLHIP